MAVENKTTLSAAQVDEALQTLEGWTQTDAVHARNFVFKNFAEITSFLNYLVTIGRVYALLGAGFDTIPRIEYHQYLMWAAGRLPNITYGTPVDRVDFDGLLISRSGGEVVARSDAWRDLARKVRDAA